MLMKRRRVISSVSNPGWVAAWDALCAAEPAAEPVTEQAAPTCHTLPPLRCLPLQINHPLFTQLAGISLTDSAGNRELCTKSPLHLTLQNSPAQISPNIWFLVILLLHSLRWALSLTKSGLLFSVSWVFLGFCFSASLFILNWERCRSMFLTNNYRLKAHKSISQIWQMTTSYQLTLLKRQEDWKCSLP